MLKIKYILPFIICSLFYACKVMDVPDPYKLNVREIGYSPYGNWAEISYKKEDTAPAQTVAGELLALNQDSIYLLIKNGEVFSISRSAVTSAALCTHKSGTGTYLLVSVLFATPAFIGAMVHTEYASEFIQMGIPATLNGLFQITMEGMSNSNFLIYPKKNELSQFQKYSRYPAGLPEPIDFTSLHLKQMNLPKWSSTAP